MQFDDQTYHQFEEYLAGNLSEEDLKAFESSLALDEKLRQELDNYRLAYEIAPALSLHSLSQSLMEDLSTGVAEQAIRKKRTRRWWMISGVAALFLTFGISFGLYSPDEHIDQTQATTKSKSRQAKTSEVQAAPSPKEEKSLDTAADHETRVTDESSPAEIEAEHAVSSDTNDPSRQEDVSPEPESVPVTSPDLCQDFSPAFPQLVIDRCCQGREDGQVLIKQETEGHSYRLLSETKNVQFKKGLASNLRHGKYTLQIENEEGCQMEFPNSITIEEARCKNGSATSNQDFAFNPDFNEVFEIPVEESDNATLTIASKNGSKSITIEIEEGFPSTWDGAEFQYKKGLYHYLLKFDDGKVKRGNLNIY